MINLLWALAAILIAMWIVGIALHFTMGGLIHALLALAIISVAVRRFTGRGHRTA